MAILTVAIFLPIMLLIGSSPNLNTQSTEFATKSMGLWGAYK
ncbi:hypothetical protein FM109_08825 [Vibrio casei]|nr:hypothetical protein FM109_08825 [Vibrio casei]